jgi:hypothetical protein
MSFSSLSFKPAPFLLLCSSLATAFLLFLLAWNGVSGGKPQSRGGYAIIALDEAVSDRDIAEKLSALPLRFGGGKTVLSESSQWAFLDDFGELLQIPLMEYSGRLEPFDPRDDGFAEKLTSFFVHDGKRFFFVPYSFGFPGKGRAYFEKQLKVCLDGIPFSVDYTGYTGPLLIFFALFVFTAAAALVLFRPRLPLAAVLPLSAGFSLSGASGFACAGFLAAGLWLFLPPLENWFFSLRYGSFGRRRRFVYAAGRMNVGRVSTGRVKARGPRYFFRRIFGTYLFRYISGVVFLLSYEIVAYISGISILLSTAGLALSAVILLFSLWIESRGGIEEAHVRFRPVPILKFSVKNGIFPQIILPFTLAALIAACFPLLSGLPVPGVLLNTGAAVPGLRQSLGENLISEEEYLIHAAFQAGFSYRSLSDAGVRYNRYILGTDGLAAEAVSAGPEPAAGENFDTLARAGSAAFFEGEIPAFPLKDLISAFSGLAAGEAPAPAAFESAGLVSVLWIALLSVPSLIVPGRGSRKKRQGKEPVSKYKKDKNRLFHKAGICLTRLYFLSFFPIIVLCAFRK